MHSVLGMDNPSLFVDQEGRAISGFIDASSVALCWVWRSTQI